MVQNKFIVIEGLEGAGKTTAVNTVIRSLIDHGVERDAIVLTREPGGTPLAEELRKLIKQDHHDEKIVPETEILLLYAARAQLIANRIKPALQAGKWVISDRHDLSTQAYQGGGRQINAQFLALLKNSVLGDFLPDITFLLDITPEQGLQRASQRGKLDRIEKETLAFFQRVRERYLALAAEDDAIVVIDANQSLDTVTDTLSHVCSNWLSQIR